MTGTEGGPDGLDRRAFLGVCVAAGAAMAGACSGAEGSDPPSENERSGDPHWRITDTGADDAIQGYADRVSVDPGEEFGLYVSTPAPAYRVSAYRIGWYDGAQARRVWRSEPLPGAVQQEPAFFPTAHTVRADWERGPVVSTEAGRRAPTCCGSTRRAAPAASGTSRSSSAQAKRPDAPS
ncbi:N,N-dimethylformamidase beta subunit family domain-containing protein [Streptomyces harbinensis]|uniref:N,N-dimethylformamidase beta subunit family domain-containing protein n=1 Tax=Streptomyces harbinensis TaxID=1176198 RepID=UPI0036858F3E